MFLEVVAIIAYCTGVEDEDEDEDKDEDEDLTRSCTVNESVRMSSPSSHPGVDGDPLTCVKSKWRLQVDVEVDTRLSAQCRNLGKWACRWVQWTCKIAAIARV